MDQDAMARIIRLAREANAAGDRERVERCLDLLSKATFNSAWDAIAREIRAATESAMAAIERERAAARADAEFLAADAANERDMLLVTERE